MHWVGSCMRKLTKACWSWELENDPESGSAERSEVVVATVAEAVAETVAEWKKMLVAFCLASAIAIATVSVQTGTKLPQAFNFLSLALLLCFGCLAFGKLTKSISKKASQILYCVGGFLAMTSVFIATAIPYAPYFRLIIFLVYLIFWLIFVFIAHKVTK